MKTENEINPRSGNQERRSPCKMIPEWLSMLTIEISRGLPDSESEQFAEDGLTAIPPDGKIVGDELRHALSVKRMNRLLRLKKLPKDVRAAIRQVRDWCADPKRTEDERLLARRVARREAEGKGEREGKGTAAESAAESAWAAVTTTWASVSAESAVMATASAEKAARMAVGVNQWAVKRMVAQVEEAAWRAEARQLLKALKDAQ